MLAKSPLLLVLLAGRILAADTRPGWSSDGKTIVTEEYCDPAASYPRCVALWDVASRVSRRLPVKMGDLQAFAFGPDKKLIAVAGRVLGDPRPIANRLIRPAVGNVLIEILDLDAGTVTNEIDTGSNSVTSLAWSDDGRQIAAAINATVPTLRVWNAANKHSLFEWHPNHLVSPILQVLWRNDILAWRDADAIRFWQAPSTTDVLPSIDLRKMPLQDADWSRASNLFAITTTNLIIYDPAAGRIAAQAPAQVNAAYSNQGFGAVSWSPDGRSVVAAKYPLGGKYRDSNVVFIFNATAKLVRTISIPDVDNVFHVSWSPNGSAVLIDGTKGNTSVIALGNPSTSSVTILHTFNML